MGCLLIKQSPQLACIAGSNLICSIVEKSSWVFRALKTKPNQQWGEKKMNYLKNPSEVFTAGKAVISLEANLGDSLWLDVEVIAISFKK